LYAFLISPMHAACRAFGLYLFRINCRVMNHVDMSMDSLDGGSTNRKREAQLDFHTESGIHTRDPNFGALLIVYTT
jgi:hypothetical protein